MGLQVDLVQMFGLTKNKVCPNCFKQIETRFDDFDIEFHDRVRASYLDSARKFDYPIISAGDSVEKVSGNIWEAVKKHF